MKKLVSIIAMLCLFTSFSNAQTHNWIRSNPGGGGAFSTIGAGASGIILAGSDLSGAYRSTNGGTSWDIIGANRGLTNTHVSGLGFDPTDGDVLFIGTEEGIFRSSDGGNSVTKSNMPDGYVTDIKICAGNHQIGYATYHPTYDSNAGIIYKTTDNGLNWSQVSNSSLPSNLRILKIVTHPTNTNIVYCLSGQGRFACGPADVFKSTDGGVNWTNISPDGDEVLDIALDKVNPGTVYCTTLDADCASQYYWNNLSGKLYVSSDGGDTWQYRADHPGVIWPKSGAAGTIRIIDPREPWPWHNDAGTWKSTDYGHNWAHTGNVNNWEVGYQNFGSTDDNLFRSYSSSFNGIAKTLGQDLSQDRIFWTNSQWVFSSSDEGSTFQVLHTQSAGSNWTSTGVDNVTMTDLAVNEADPNIIFLGYHDMGLWKSEDGGSSWFSCNESAYTGDWAGYGGNTFTVASDPDRPQVVWATMQGDWDAPATLLRSTAGGTKGSWTTTNGLPNTVTTILDITIDKNSSSTNRTLFVTADGSIYKSTDDGQNWTEIFNNSGCRFIGIDPNNSSILYAGGESGLFQSTDGGNTWNASGNSEMQGSGPYAPENWSGVSQIHINAQGHIYVSAFGSGKGLYRSTDNGTTWQKIKSDDFLRSFTLVPNQPNLIYTASSSAFTSGGYDPDSKGVEYSEDSGQTWHSANDGMAYPFAVCIEATHETTPTIWVGSPGSGFQKAMIPSQILPVDMLQPFSARIQNNQVLLQWKTSEESQNKAFLISRSTNLTHWESIKYIRPSLSKTYAVIDSNPLEGISYYRLAQKDLDGALHYLGTVSIHFQRKHPPVIFPNPTNGIVRLSFENKPRQTRLYLYDPTGRLLLSQKGNQIDMGTLPDGIYLLKIQTDHDFWQESIVKMGGWQ